MENILERHMQGAWIFTSIEQQIQLDIHIVFLSLMKNSLWKPMCSCFSQHQLLKTIFMERLLFMDVKIIAFELPTQNHKNNDQGLQGNSLRKGSWS